MNDRRGEQFHGGDNDHRRHQEASDYRESEQWGASNLGAPGGSGYAANRSLSSRPDFGREGSAKPTSGQRLYGGRSSYMDDDYGYPERGGIDARPPASYPGYNSPEQGYGNDETGAASFMADMLKSSATAVHTTCAERYLHRAAAGSPVFTMAP